MYSTKLKERALFLRKQGKSLLSISQELHVAKSTASLWLSTEKNRGIYGTMTKQQWMAHIQKKSVVALHQRTITRQLAREKLANQQIRGLKTPLETKRALLSLLYWAEGAKGKAVLDFANTSPELCLLFITLLRECYDLDETKLRIRLHLHKYHDELKQKEFWSELLKIPTTQFNAIIWKKEPNSGKRYRQNYHGICFLKYNSVDLQKRIMAYAHILGRKLTKNAPVA